MDINQQIIEVQKSYPTLKFSPETNQFSGELFITSNDSYMICLDINPYPQFFPNVYEKGERIPIKADRHMYTNTGSCCLTTKSRAQILLKTKVKTLKCFVSDIVIPYFQNNSYYELNKCYKTEEYSHGIKGDLEGYADILQISNVRIILKTIYDRINGDKLKIHDKCYCGSGLKMKNCFHGTHDLAYRNFKMIDIDVLKYDLNSFLPLLEQ